MPAVATNRTKTHSFAAALVDLSVGQVASKAEHLDENLSVREASDAMRTYKQRMTQNVCKAVSRASGETGGKYSMDVVHVMTDKGITVIALITRIS